MHANSPPGTVYALDLSGLQQLTVSFFTVWDGDDLLGCGALKQLDPTTASSSRCGPAHGTFAAGRARSCSSTCCALRAHGGIAACVSRQAADLRSSRRLRCIASMVYVPAAPFGDYVATEFNQFFELAL